MRILVTKYVRVRGPRIHRRREPRKICGYTVPISLNPEAIMAPKTVTNIRSSNAANNYMIIHREICSSALYVV